MSYQTYFQRYLPLLEAYMQDVISPPHPRVALHYEMMAYHLGWRDEQLRPVRANAGKRVRPMLCLLACEAVGGRIEHAMPAAAGIELLHNFSLIHDDIEDNSPTRRHRPTVWRLWGIPQAINVGDAMFSLAHHVIYKLSEYHPPKRVVRAYELFDRTCVALTEGQHLDMRFEHELEVSEEDYLFMIRGKTAALIATSVAMGALLGGASTAVQKAYYAFGENMGIAFQIVDDILGIWGDEARLGKSTASDILTKKKTLPILYGLHHPDIGEELRTLYAGRPFTTEDVTYITSLLDRIGAREYASGMARHYHEQALRALESTGVQSKAHEALRAFAEDLIKRET